MVVATPETFNGMSIMESDPSYVVFYKKTCPYCRDVFPALEELEKKIKVYYVDVEQLPAVRQMFLNILGEEGPKTVPSFYLYNKGMLVARYRGADRTTQTLFYLMRDVVN